MAKLIVESHIIKSLRTRVDRCDALSEWIDNSLRAGATEIKITLDKDCVSITDNGHGVKDINDLATLGASCDDEMNIFGIGAKDAMLHFGSLVHIWTVYKGKFHRHIIDWDKIEKDGTPKPYNPKSAIDASRAPVDIRGGGTMIAVNRLTGGRSHTFLEALIKRLCHRYRPALRKGARIALFGPENVEHVLTADADAVGLWKNEHEIIGEACGLTFNVRYTDCKEYDRNLSGIHIGYGHRFIKHITKLNGKTLPPLLYAEVMLASRWRDYLNANKTDLVRYSDELEAAVYDLLKNWIKELEEFADEARIEKLNVLLARATSNILTFKPATKGNYDEGGDVDVTERGGGENPDDPNPHVKKKKAKPGENGDAEPRKRRPGGLHFRRSDTLGHIPYHMEVDQAAQKLTVLLNGSIPAIDLAYQVPYKLQAIWPLISHALGDFAKTNATSLDDVLPGFLTTLESCGYLVDMDKLDDLRLSVVDWMLRQQPVSLEKTLEVAA